MLWIVHLVHSFFCGIAPVGADFEEIVVEGIADFEEDIGVNPFATHDFVEVLAGVADLLRQPGDGPPLPHQLGSDALPDMKVFDGSFFIVHSAVLLGAFFSVPAGQQKKALTFLLLIILVGSGKPLALINKKQFTPKTQTFRLLILMPLKFTRFY